MQPITYSEQSEKHTLSEQNYVIVSSIIYFVSNYLRTNIFEMFTNAFESVNKIENQILKNG